MSEIKLIVRPFAMGTEKEAANKVQEEANEAVHAWRSFADVLYPITTAQKPSTCMLKSTCTRLADEIADTIQASCNLAARYGIDLQAAMERCEKRNRERGRYEDEDAKPCRVHDGDNRGCGGSCGAVPVGMDVLREKTPEEMSAAELHEMLRLLVRDDRWIENFCFTDGWCFKFHRCNDCVLEILDLLKAAYKQEKKDAQFEEFRLASAIGRRDKEIDRLKREIKNLTHERDGLQNRLAELDDAGITRLHRLLREAMGEAKNVTHNARVYIDKQQGSKDERCGDCGTDSGRDSCVCGAERAREHLLPAEPPAQEMNEREKVVERLRGYDVYMTEPPSKNANRLFACITGNKDAEIACGNDIEAVRDKLIELISEGGAE